MLSTISNSLSILNREKKERERLLQEIACKAKEVIYVKPILKHRENNSLGEAIFNNTDIINNLNKELKESKEQIEILQDRIQELLTAQSINQSLENAKDNLNPWSDMVNVFSNKELINNSVCSNIK